MRYRLARISLVAALAAGVIPMLTAPASADCGDPAVCYCVHEGPVDVCVLCTTPGPTSY